MHTAIASRMFVRAVDQWAELGGNISSTTPLAVGHYPQTFSALKILEKEH